MVKYYKIPVISHLIRDKEKSTTARWSTYSEHGGTCQIIIHIAYIVHSHRGMQNCRQGVN